MKSNIIVFPFRHAIRLQGFRDFIASRAFAERQARITDMILGSVWFLLGPLLEMLVYFFLVSIVFDRDNFGDVPTFLGIMVGLMHFRLFQIAVQQSVTSIVANRKILLQIRVEPMAFVAVSFFRQLQDAKYYVPLAIVAFLFYRYVPSSNIVVYPLALFVMCLAAWSCALLAACAYVYIRDLQIMLQTGLRLLLYASPVIYPATFLPDHWLPYYYLNPFAVLFTLIQGALFGMPFPPIEYIVGALVFFATLFFAAHYFYEKRAPYFTKIM